jgi:hypothetical protein
MAAEDQGIMSLPMQGQEAAQPMPQMPLEESYDAVSQGLQNAAPQAAADIQQLMAGILPQLDQLSDEDLNSLLQMVQYLQEGGEAEYPKRLQEVIAAGALDPEDLPEEYDPEVLSAIGTVLLQAVRQRQAGAQAAQGPMPTEQQFARGGIAEAARIVAGRGRSGDTMLAHINPEEARLLRSHGGMGTINPKTGLPEYGFLKNLGKQVKAVFKSIGKQIKGVLKSPIGRVLATVALATFLGPAGIGLASATFAAPIAAGTVTALGGGNLKQVLTSAATAYFGAPGGTVSQYVGAAGITNVAANAAVTAGIVGTGTALLSGQKFADAVKTGLTAGATSGISTGLTQGFGTTGGEEAALTPARQPLAPVEDAVVSPNLPAAPTPASVNAQIASGAPTAPAPVAPPASPLLTQPVPDYFKPAAAAPAAPAPAQAAGAPYNPSAGLQLPPGAAPEPGYTVAGSPSTAGGTPTAGASFQRMTDGIGDLMTGKEGAFDTIKQGASDLFFPKTMSAAELQNTEAFQNARNAGASYSEAMKAATSANNPSLLRQYGPLAAAGIGVMGLAGGFKPGAPPSPTLVRGSGQELIDKDPNKYMIQGLPGVQYNAQGNITGSTSWSPFASMADVRAPAYDYLNPRRAANGGIASLATGGYPRKTGAISGPGTETSDSIPAMLSDGEFVMTAQAVKAMGNGSRRAGAKKMYALMHQLERNASRG